MPNRYEREYGYDVMRLETSVRDKVLSDWRDNQVCDDWWDFVYEDAKRMGALMGIEVQEIQFSGFCSQGDGASFTGEYSCKPDAVEAIVRECGNTDKKLIAIATELTVLQTTWKLQHGFTWECIVQRFADHSVHSGTMQTGWPDDQEEYNAIGFTICGEMDLKMQSLMRRFADWIYRQLEAEYDHLTSEKSVLESIRSSGLRFTSAGETIRL